MAQRTYRHNVRKRARDEFAHFGTALLVGMLATQLLTYGCVHWWHTWPWVQTAVAIPGDSLGFYTTLICLRARRLRRATTAQRNQLGSAAAAVAREWWLNELVDVTWVRVWTLILATAWIANHNLANLTGNLMSDIVFFGSWVLAGRDLSGWLADKTTGIARAAWRRTRTAPNAQTESV